MAKDRRLQRPKRRPGLDPELLAEKAAQLLEASEGIGLAPGTVEGQHSLAPQSLTEGVLTSQTLEFAGQLAMASNLQVRFDPPFERGEAGLFEARRLALSERKVEEVGERRPAPQRERGAEDVRRSFVVTDHGPATAFAGQLLEPEGVVGLGVHPQDIAGRAAEQEFVLAGVP
jgi:hypothetical protein